MTYKDYKAIAAALYRCQPDRDEPAKRVQWGQCVEEISFALVGTSGAYDRGRFVSACYDITTER